MKDYKKSLVIFNLLLIGAVLFVMNTAIMVYSYRTGVEELKTVMQQRCRRLVLLCGMQQQMRISKMFLTASH